MTDVASRLRLDETTPARPALPGRGTPDIALLPIGADLLPPRGATGRGGRGTRLIAIGLVLVAVVAVAGASLFSAHARSGAQADLAAAQDQQRSLQVRQQSFADLVRTKAQATDLRDALATIMATDAPWSTLLADLGKVRGGVTFTSVQAGVADPSAPSAAAPGPVTPGGIGTLSISGTAADKPTIAAFVDALGGLTGLADPFLSNVSASSATTGGASFTVSVTLTGDLGSAAPGRWTTTTGGGK